MSDTLQSSMMPTNNNGVVSVAADLSNAYWNDSNSVQHWTRNLQYSGDTLRITDTCTVANGIRPVFQLHVPVQPVLQQDGSVVAGHLHVVSLQGVAVPSFLDMTTEPPQPGSSKSDFNKGFRIDFASTVGCAFSFELDAQ
jgi:hypothetical protein